MNRKKKIRRCFILIFSVYIILNYFVFGFIKAYVNTNNTINKEQLAIAYINDEQNIRNIEVLGKNFIIDKNNNINEYLRIGIYTVMTDKMRISADIVFNLKKYIFKVRQ